MASSASVMIETAATLGKGASKCERAGERVSERVDERVGEIVGKGG